MVKSRSRLDNLIQIPYKIEFFSQYTPQYEPEAGGDEADQIGGVDKLRLVLHARLQSSTLYFHNEG